jgi:hypothetical protein
MSDHDHDAMLRDAEGRRVQAYAGFRRKIDTANIHRRGGTVTSADASARGSSKLAEIEWLQRVYERALARREG